MEFSPLKLITSATRFSERPRVVNPHRLPARFSDILAGIAKTKKILVLSGDGALAGTGLPPLDAMITVQHISDSRRVSLRNLMHEIAQGLPDALSTGRLAVYNQAMAERRVAARSAAGNVFLDFLNQICREGRLTKCLTSSIDGFEARSLHGLSEVVSLYGDNRIVRCATSRCQGVTEMKTSLLDNNFISQTPAPCELCTASYKKANTVQRRRRGGDAIRLLRPAVQSHISLSFTAVDMIVFEDDKEEDKDYVEESSSAIVNIGDRAGMKARDQPSGDNQGKRSRRSKRKPAIELPSLDTATIKEYLEGSKLLLIVGSQPRDPDLLNLTRDLAFAVHEGDGAVIYLDEAPLHGVQYDHIDIQLQANIQETLGEILLQMKRIDNHNDADEGTVCTDADFWFDLIQNDIPIRFTEQEALYTGDLCSNCSCAVTDYLVACIECSQLYCHRRVDNQGSDDDDDDDSDMDLEMQQDNRAAAAEWAASATNSQVPSPADPPGTDDESDHFEFHEACIGFNALSNQNSNPSIADSIKSFICPACWDHDERGLYPHYVRPQPRDSVESRQDAWPRLAMVVFYIEQFWPQTKHLLSLTAGRWKQLGWECMLEPVKLQHIEEKEEIFRDLQWEQGSYQVIVVYITHGLSGEQGYQMNNSQALRPVDLLTRTLRLVQRAIATASSSSVFFFSCGHPLHHPGLVKELCDWSNDIAVPGVVVGCLNKKLAPVYMFNMLSKLTQALADGTEDRPSIIRNTWLRDSVACSHSDLLCLARGQAAELWVYAPFRSRPLGKPLPSLLSVCPCFREQGAESAGVDRRRRKVWKVDHNGKPGMALREIKVKAICQACRQSWPLPQETMAGTLIRINGVYGAVVPYFA